MSAPALDPGGGEQLPDEEYLAGLVAELLDRAATDEELAARLVLVDLVGLGR